MEIYYKIFTLSISFLLSISLKANVSSFYYAHEILPYVAKLMPEKPIIVEAGAYDGADSVHLAKTITNCTVHSFEPVPELYNKVLTKTQGVKNIFTYQMALSDKDGESLFYVSELAENPGVASASSSLLPPKEHTVLTPQLSFPTQISVKTTTLDTWAAQNGITHVDFLWLDMQGYEMNMLKGSPKILKTVKAILTEVEFIEAYLGQYLFADIKKFLEAEGFILKALSTAGEWFGDALFVRE
ncbi:MAG TPA: FkbM family methyltransferase [Candidatus Babeliales bacterium]|nr:FkbM family methyltransferase [Candidatus Babeliales bacterium]